MTQPSQCPALPPNDSPVALLGQHLARLLKLTAHLRHALPQLRPGVDNTAYPILFSVAHGPLRVSALAERIFSDISTVSRQVGALESHGLVTRQPDPDDRRASLVVLTDEGGAFIRELVARRDAVVARVVADWSERDVATLAQLIGRLVEDAVDAVDVLHGRTKGPAQ